MCTIVMLGELYYCHNNGSIYRVMRIYNLVMRGISSCAPHFMLVMGTERAELAAVSALSLPRILTFCGIQHNTVDLVSVRSV